MPVLLYFSIVESNCPLTGKQQSITFLLPAVFENSPVPSSKTLCISFMGTTRGGNTFPTEQHGPG